MAAVTVLTELNAAIRAAEHLRGKVEYRAAIEVARTLARQIDGVRGETPSTASRVTNVAIPTMHKVLTGLGLTPEGLARLAVGDDDEGDEVDAIRGERAGLRSV